MDQSGKWFVVTGGNIGLGYSTAKSIAAQNGNVIIICRNEEKAKEAVSKLKTEVQSQSQIEYELADFSSLKSVKGCTEKLLEKFNSNGLYCLVNNAGVFMLPHGLTEDGLEQQFQINYVSPVLLTMLLLPVLQKYGKGARVVNVSSDSHSRSYPEKIRLTEELINDQKTYNSLLSYGESKLGNILFTTKLDKIVFEKYGLLVNSCHPGFVATDIPRKANFNRFLKPIFLVIVKLVAKTPEDGAKTQTFLAAEKDLKFHGVYLSEQTKKADKVSNYSEELEEKLWRFTLQILEKRGFKIDIP